MSSYLGGPDGLAIDNSASYQFPAGVNLLAVPLEAVIRYLTAASGGRRHGQK